MLPEKKLSNKLFRFHLQEPTVIKDAEKLEALIEAAENYIDVLENCVDLYYKATESNEAKVWRRLHDGDV